MNQPPGLRPELLRTTIALLAAILVCCGVYAAVAIFALTR
jgi:hypothetical protein